MFLFTDIFMGKAYACAQITVQLVINTKREKAKQHDPIVIVRSKHLTVTTRPNAAQPTTA